MRFVALDVGDVRIGIAVCDELEIAAYPVCTIKRVGSLKRDIEAIVSQINNLDCSAVIVGLPLSLDGSVGPQAQKVLGFIKSLCRSLSQPIETWDESLSSVDADDLMIRHGVSRRKRREVIDQIAAVIILESYLEYRRTAGISKDCYQPRLTETDHNHCGDNGNCR